MKRNISLEEARQLLLAHCQPPGVEEVPFSDSLGRVLGANLIAGENVPPFARAAYDGYAFRSADTVSATREHPVFLEVIEEVPAGHAPRSQVGAGQAVKILTGAPVPEGADVVEKFEATTLAGNRVAIYASYPPGTNIVPAGEDVSQGEVVAQKGQVVDPPLVGLMAALGMTRVPVYRRPQIAVISTGDELLEVDEPLRPGKIRNSNGHALAAYCAALGGAPAVLKTPQDRVEEIGAAIQAGLDQAQLVITTGGVSVGDYDLVYEALRSIKAEILYWKIDMRPGSPTLAAVKDGKVVLSLSGNPASAMVVFQLLGIPFIRKLAGRSDYLLPEIEVTLKEGFAKASPVRRFLRGKLVYEQDRVYLETAAIQRNSVLRSMIGCDVLAEIPAGSGPVPAGSRLKAYLLK